jgi:hypothetical protein
MIRQTLTYLSLPWVGTILGLTGVGLAILFYYRSKRRARLACQITEFSVVGGQYARFPTELQISFAGQPVDRVTSSRVVIWNSGNVTLNATDIVDSDPLRLEVEDGAILRASVQRVNRDVNRIELTPSPTSPSVTKVTFDFLDQSDGIAATILHSGGRNSLRCKGTLKGVPSGITNVKVDSDFPFFFMAYSRQRMRRFVVYFPLILGLIAALGGLFWPTLSFYINKVDSQTTVSSGSSWPVVTAGLFYILASSLVLWQQRRRYPSALQEAATPKAPSKNAEVA